MDKVEMSGFIVLFSGVAALLFTFYNAYLFLAGILKISISTDLMGAFGQALTPLIETCIRAIYLGLMGWIGSILTRRGVQIVTAEKEETKTKETEKKPKTKPQAEKEQIQAQTQQQAQS